MRTNGKQILITTESHEVLVIRRGGIRPDMRSCPLCGSLVEVEPETTDDINALVIHELQHSSDDEIEREISGGKKNVHSK